MVLWVNQSRCSSDRIRSTLRRRSGTFTRRSSRRTPASSSRRPHHHVGRRRRGEDSEEEPVRVVQHEKGTPRDIGLVQKGSGILRGTAFTKEITIQLARKIKEMKAEKRTRNAPSTSSSSGSGSPERNGKGDDARKYRVGLVVWQ